MKNMKLWQCKIRGFEAKNQSNLEEKISLCLLRSVVGRDDDSRWPNQHATSLVFSLEREAIRPILQPFFLRPFRVEVVQKDSLVSNIVLLKPIPPPSKDNICNFFLSKSEEVSDWAGSYLTSWRTALLQKTKNQIESFPFSSILQQFASQKNLIFASQWDGIWCDFIATRN